MLDNDIQNLPYVIFRLLDQQYAISSYYVREMVLLPKVAPVPQTPSYVRGVINLRGKVLPVFDLRQRMGMQSFTGELEDLISLLDQRERDHRNWLSELESSVRERRDFKLATDPHKCAFGKWYDNFTTDNRTLDTCLRRFDAPHREIHGIALKVRDLVAVGDFDAAHELIQQTKDNALAEMIKLFAEVRRLLLEDQREIVICLEIQQGMIQAAAVDSIETVEKLTETGFEELPDIMGTASCNFIAGLGKRSKGDDFVQLLNMETIFGAKIRPDA